MIAVLKLSRVAATITSIKSMPSSSSSYRVKLKHDQPETPFGGNLALLTQQMSSNDRSLER